MMPSASERVVQGEAHQIPASEMWISRGLSLPRFTRLRFPDAVQREAVHR